MVHAVRESVKRERGVVRDDRVRRHAGGDVEGGRRRHRHRERLASRDGELEATPDDEVAPLHVVREQAPAGGRVVFPVGGPVRIELGDREDGMRGEEFLMQRVPLLAPR